MEVMASTVYFGYVQYIHIDGKRYHLGFLRVDIGPAVLVRTRYPINTSAQGRGAGSLAPEGEYLVKITS